MTDRESASPVTFRRAPALCDDIDTPMLILSPGTAARP